MNKHYFLLFGFLHLLSIKTCMANTLDDDNDSTLTVATGDTTLQTKYIQNAINYCSSTGGGTIRLTAGVYRTAPLLMKSNITLRIDSAATLQGSPIMADWTVGTTLRNLLYTSGNLTNVRITGQGTIDGSGAPWWAAFNANNAVNRPRLIYLSNVTNLTIDSLNIQNSPTFHIVPNNCRNVVIDHITINTDKNSPNTDGIDPSGCYNVLITNCSVSVGDDNIAIKAGSNCQDITVANCTFGYGHGLSIGSETNGGYNNLRVTGCTFKSTTNGIRIKSGPGIGGLVSNTYYSNITMTGVTNPIVVDFTYANTVTTPPKIPAVNNFFINNLTVTGSGNAGTFLGLTNSLIQNIVLTNVNIAAKKGMAISFANGVTFKNVIINKAPAKNGTNVITTSVTGIQGF
ncbi:glycoside hydrolase family 28 protein [Parasediminibacterium sp. JCM 36343]|uniref:glycoside hydrolase family 28 protein n=1 Tax=Parasediminibacterium sp. JCM 36343 TaxID=3374279 RepID=UPI00397A1133